MNKSSKRKATWMAVNKFFLYLYDSGVKLLGEEKVANVNKH